MKPGNFIAFTHRSKHGLFVFHAAGNTDCASCGELGPADGNPDILGSGNFQPDAVASQYFQR